MKRNVLAQAMVGGIASNPANGINNIPLQNAGGSSGVSPDELLGILEEVKNANPQQMQAIRTRLEAVRQRLTNPGVTEAVDKILTAFDFEGDPRKKTINPSTGEPVPGPQELAAKLTQTVESMNQQNEQAKKFNAASAVFNLREAQRRKKKSRGNPFRVLMGKVGKLLDHGLEKRDIVRYLKKSGYWNDETIERAVDIVRDYNKKKRRDDTDEESKPSKQGKDGKESKKASVATPTMQRISAAPETIYDVAPDFGKMSLTELMARASWLMSLMSWGKDTPQGDGKKAADKKGAAAELKAIKQALIDRGFDQDELSMMGIK